MTSVIFPAKKKIIMDGSYGLGGLCCLQRSPQPRENNTRELPQEQLDMIK